MFNPSDLDKNSLTTKTLLYIFLPQALDAFSLPLAVQNLHHLATL